jgi:hypothetical protein
MNTVNKETHSDVEELLPWHAAGTLSRRDAQRVEEALGADPELARRYAMVREELGETILLNETLGAPSAHAMEKLFARIDAEPARKPALSLNLTARVSGFFASLSPRTLAWSASLGALALVLQAGVIGAVLMKNQGSTYRTASLNMDEPASLTRNLNGDVAQPPRALVRFAPDAKVADINALLDSYKASIVDAKGGMFRLQFGDKAISKDEATGLINKLQREKIVSLAVAAQ